MKKLRILVADDHKILREGLVLLIHDQPDMQVIGQAGTGNEVLHQVRALKPDLVVMDLSMPELNGLQAAQAMSTECPQVKVVVLTVHEDESYLRELCKAQASGYVLKRSAGQELIHAIREVAAGGVYFDPTLASRALAGQARELKGKRDFSGADLSKREKEVLSKLAWGYTNKEVADQLSLSVKTVETYRIRVSEKLGLSTRVEMMKYALRQGWLGGSDSALSGSH